MPELNEAGQEAMLMQQVALMQKQMEEMQQQLAASQEQNAALEQAMQDLVDGLQSEKDEAGKEGFYQRYKDEFGGNHEYSDRAWQMYEGSDKSVDEREFVSHLVSRMDNEMLRYLAAKGLFSMVEQPEEGEVIEEEVITEPEPAETLQQEVLEDEGGELSPREKVNRLLMQNE